MDIDSPSTYDSDQATPDLIMQLQNEDTEELLNASKGADGDGEFSDAYRAFTTSQQELKRASSILPDRSLSRRLAPSINSAALSGQSGAEEDVAASDRTRALAQWSSGVNTPTRVPQPTTAAQDLDEGSVARPQAIYVSGGNNEDRASEKAVHSDSSSDAESSAWATSRPQVSTASHHCTACTSAKPLSDLYQTPCGHFYCQKCIQNLFELSATDETLFPPRCCRQPIPLSSIKMYLSSATVQIFEKKSIEFQTQDRTYCSQQACSSFIPKDHTTGELATCGECGTQTCTVCKANAHNGDCPQDTETQQILEIARECGWQRCYKCRRVVELEVGCNHIV